MCAPGDSNSHGFRPRVLSAVCLPFHQERIDSYDFVVWVEESEHSFAKLDNLPVLCVGLT